MPAAELVICGAGIAGVSLAHTLAARHGAGAVTLVDERPPLSLTSGRGTGGFRNWWPGRDGVMVRFMNRSLLRLLELDHASGGAFALRQCGYAFLTGRDSRVAEWRAAGPAVCAQGAGEWREHPGPARYPESPARSGDAELAGVDLVADPAEIHRRFPFATPEALGLLHVRRAGTLDPAALGRWLLEEAVGHGVRVVRARFQGAEVRDGRVTAVHLDPGGRLPCGALALCPGPHLQEAAAMLGVELPVANESHAKLAIADPLGIVPADAPLMLWDDPVTLDWTPAEYRALEAEPRTRHLTGPLPAGIHFRVREAAAGRELLLIWTWERRVAEAPVDPPAFPPETGEVLLRALTRLVPGLAAYHGRAGQGRVDGGYYCRTRENRPLIGPLPLGGAYVCAALSGYGVMASQAAAEMAAAHIAGAPLPEDAAWFLPERYQNAAYRSRLPALEAADGQL